MTTLLHKYWKTAAMAASSYIGDSPLFLIDYLLRLLRVIVLLSIWRTILAGKGTVSGMTLEAVLTYTLVAEVFAAQLSPRTTLDEVFWNGTIVGRLLQPLGIFGQFSADMFGRWLFEFGVFSVPLLLLAPLLGVSALPAGAGAAGLFVLSLVLAISVGLAIEFVFGGLLVLLQLPHWAVSQVRSAITTLLIGRDCAAGAAAAGRRRGLRLAAIRLDGLGAAPDLYRRQVSRSRCWRSRSAGRLCCGRWHTGCGA